MMPEINRKRAFSQVATSVNLDRHTQAPRFATASAMFDFALLTYHANKENESPFNETKRVSLDTSDESLAMFRLSQLNKEHSLQGQALQALAQQPSASGHFHPELTLNLPPYLYSDILSINMNATPGPSVYEDNTMTAVGTDPTGPLTPSALKMQDLSLQELPIRTRPKLPLRPSTYLIPSGNLTLVCSFKAIRPNDIIIVFNKGHSNLKVDKYPLCAASRLFTQMIDGPFLPGQTRVIRLRGDYPYAIHAMIEFIETRNYAFRPVLVSEYPHVTELDFHVQVYLVGSKYGVAMLCEYAIDQYVATAHSCLDIKVGVPWSDMSIHVNTLPLRHMSPNTSQQSRAVAVGEFLDSLALLWCNTPGRFDPMRAAALELIKYHLHRVSRFRAYAVLLENVDGFCTDLKESLADDGLEVKTYLVPEGEQGGLRFG
ncbi:hypothetical protein GQ44DRAFT_724802 [Phaeosphaeriaceae sp. PMI808]|nr:hypothetical protein GQ44DRAFT_724802 [Phaeosphaeriaceae sp. PMI808]